MRVNGRDGLTPHSAEAARSASPQTAHCAADALAVGLVRISALRRVEILLVLSRASDRVLVRDGLVLFAPEHALLIYHSLAEAAEAFLTKAKSCRMLGSMHVLGRFWTSMNNSPSPGWYFLISGSPSLKMASA